MFLLYHFHFCFACLRWNKSKQLLLSAEWNLAQHTTRTQHTQQFILQLYFSNTTHMLHSCVYTCSHKYTHVELHNSHMTLKIGYYSWKIVIFLVFLTQFSIFTITEAVWTAECADKWLNFVQQNEADKKIGKFTFGELKIWNCDLFLIEFGENTQFWHTLFEKLCTHVAHMSTHVSFRFTNTQHIHNTS